jgi:hypothetical protein
MVGGGCPSRLVKNVCNTDSPSITNEAERLRGLSDQRIAVGPVVAVARERSHALLIFLDDQAITVVLDFVKPVRAGRHFGGAGWNAGLKGAGWHVGR